MATVIIRSVSRDATYQMQIATKIAKSAYQTALMYHPGRRVLPLPFSASLMGPR